MFSRHSFLLEKSDIPSSARLAIVQRSSFCPERFNEMRNSSSTSSSQNHMSRVEPQHSEKGEIFVLGLWGVRYQVEDVVRSVASTLRRLDSNWTSRILQLSRRSRLAISNSY